MNFLLIFYDTVYIKIPEYIIDSIVNTISNQQKDILSPGLITLLAATVGALAALLPQLIMYLLKQRKEKSRLKMELIAEERRLAFLITEYNKELVMHKVHKHYWLRLSSMLQFPLDDRNDSHQRHFLSSQRAFETETKIGLSMSEYFKTITHYTNLMGRNENILIS